MPISSKEMSTSASWIAPTSRVFFMTSAVALLFLGQPLALLFPAINFDESWLRILISLTGIGLFMMGVVFWRLQRNQAFRVFCWVSGAVLIPFYFYPPGLHGHGFAFQLPILLLLMIPANLLLANHRFALNRCLRLAVPGFLLLITLQFIRRPEIETIRHALPFFAFAVIPLATSILIRAHSIRPLQVGYVFGGLWFVSLIYGYLDVLVTRQQVIGISGNQNWIACVLLACIPWAALTAEALIKKIRPGISQKVQARLAWSIVIIPSIYLLVACDSRALYVTVAGYALFRCIYHLPRKFRVLFMALLIATGVLLLFAGRESLARAADVDVRIPLWKSTLLLIRENPLLGIGPDRLATELPEVLAGSGYFDRFVAGSIVEHVHNEILQFMVLLGIPAALIWMVLVVPSVFGKPCGRDQMFRYAQFTLFSCLAMAMFDKALHRPPANLLMLLALGLCWSHNGALQHIRPYNKLPLFRLTFSSAAAIGLLIVCVPITAAHWFHRRGLQLQAFQQYRPAYHAHMHALTWRPESIESAYAAAVIAVQHLQDPERAHQALELAYERNPRYGHINRLQGRHFYQLGQFETAAEYFRRELRLYPRDIISWQWLYISLARTDERGSLPEIDEILQQLYIRRIRSFERFARQKDLGQQLGTAIATGDWTASMITANQIIGLVPSHWTIDPQAPWQGGRDWPPDFAKMNFGPDDVSYWESIRLRNDPSLGKSREAIFDAVCNRVTILDADAEWTSPAETWALGQGNVESSYQLLSWLMPQPTLIYPAERPEEWFALHFQAGHIWRLQLGSKTMEQVSDKADLPDDFGERARLFVLPHEFTCRHQIIGAVIQGTFSHRYPASSPTSRSLELERYVQAHSIQLDGATLLAPETMEPIRSRPTPHPSRANEH